ncbi:hypothetical protein AYM40_34885 [Paraburkholderia phytofirmans OLGA172]|uniref:Uncharacterized protein n=1 Tax=Paraburkholderia phytofirmans OLGA172 TaxID=1417228 RepID=A0A167WKE7_9BURK|nr:hypothetical protein [Paraburkholderia phytofirmans]ANB77277.1 hypothetical protein AYM40_34885 [Paraburkholderia phytofirmans OLGA172]
MSQLDYIYDLTEFTPLWDRANAGVRLLANVPREKLLYFDPFDIVTPRLFGLVQTLLAIKGTTDFATVILKPDPFKYFHYHFGKYPGFVYGRDNTYVEFFDLMMQDPGDSPADALGVNYDHFVIMPMEGDWIAFGDHPWDTGVSYGPPDIMACARKIYPYFGTPPNGFRIEP